MRMPFVWKILRLALLARLVLLATPGVSIAYAKDARDACRPSDVSFEIGLGKSDITPSVSARNMLGYADPWQRSNGLHMRLWSRAVYLKDPCSAQKNVMVIADLGLIFGNVKAEVLKRLDRKMPGLFTGDDLMISATHTHSGPGAYSSHFLYNITAGGFDSDALEAIAEGMTRSIIQAYDSRFEGRVEFHKGELKGVQFNRSLGAYNQNPQRERDHYRSPVDSEVQMLVFKDRGGNRRGSWNWFPVHGVSLSSKNHLLSGDNKGYAAYRLEADESGPEKEFVGGFVQSHSGDVSPYEMNDETEDFRRNEISGFAQYAKAKELMAENGEILRGSLRSLERHYDLRHRLLKEHSASGALRRTCEGTLGVAFAAGTENGRPLKIFHEETVYGKDWPRFTLMPKEQDCQAEKVILLPTGMMKPYSWTANVAPFQIQQIASLAVVAVPFEMTTMAGRRIKKALLAKLKDHGITDIAITALANDYLHYVTTREEYAAQAYEGGSNLFGPWSLDAYIEILEGLADEMIQGKTNAVDPIDERPRKPLALPSLPSMDWPGFAGRFAELFGPQLQNYQAGDLIEVSFIGGELNYRSDDSLIEIQRLDNAMSEGNWMTVYSDADPQTKVSWERLIDFRTVVHVKWQSSRKDPLARYRVCHRGSSQFLWQKRIPYNACSPIFSLLKPIQ
jgi:neutral ceramidase